MVLAVAPLLMPVLKRYMSFVQCVKKRVENELEPRVDFSKSEPTVDGIWKRIKQKAGVMHATHFFFLTGIVFR